MALAYGTAYGSWASGAGNPVTYNFTCGATAKVLVVVILNATTTARTTDAPTYNGVNMTLAGSKQAGTAECNVELWYLLNPTTGASLQISIDNDGSLTLYSTCCTLTSAASATYYGVTQTGVSTANPSCTINNVPAGGACVAVLGHGYKDPPTGRSNTVILETDQGAWSSNAQYGLNAGLANVTMTWTMVDTDDTAMVMAAFQEVAGTTHTIGGSVASTTAAATKVRVRWLIRGTTGALSALTSGVRIVRQIGCSTVSSAGSIAANAFKKAFTGAGIASSSAISVLAYVKRFAGGAIASTSEIGITSYVKRFIGGVVATTSSVVAAAALLGAGVTHVIGAAIASIGFGTTTTESPGSGVKYWSWGLPYGGLDSEGSVKYWSWGLPYEYIYEEGVSSGASIWIMRKISAAIAALSEMTSSVRLIKFIGGVITATSGVVASITLIELFEFTVIGATIASISSMIGAVIILRAIGGSIASTSSVTSTIWVRYLIGAVVSSASGVVSGLILKGFVSVAAAIAATSAVTGALIARYLVRGTISSTSSTDVTTFVRRMVGAQIIASSTTFVVSIYRRIIVGAQTITATSTAVTQIWIRWLIGGVITATGNFVAAVYLAGAPPVAAVGRALINTYRYIIKHTVKALHIGTESKDDNIED